MTSSYINSAAGLIRQIDPALAEAFLSKRFHRHQLVTAFFQSLQNSTTYAPMAERIAVTLRSAIDMDQAESENSL